MRGVFKLPRLLGNCGKLLRAMRNQMTGRGEIRENDVHVRAGVKWLMRAQEKGGGGFSRRYCLYDGWDRPYIETTGYIIPTMLSAGRYLKDGEVAGSAKRAAHWLLGMQKENGAFCDTDTGVEQVFDTGQVLYGLMAAFCEWGDERFLNAAVRAGRWLVEIQEEDGSWERHAYNGIKHSYYVKVAAALLKLSQMTNEEGFRESAMKNISWTLGCQEEDGYFKYMHFRDGEYPFLHTITYVLEGLMDSYDILKDQRFLEAAMSTVSALGGINQKRDMLLCSQYGANWTPVNRERCIAGLAQWAGIAGRAYEYSGNEALLRQAIKTLYYLKSKQHPGPDPDLYGALPGSVPLWGKYLGFCYPNWGIKYFIDLLIAFDKYGMPTWQEQEIWVSESFKFSDAVVSDKLGNNDLNYVRMIEKELDTGRSLAVLDVGCGKGKFIQYFTQMYPHWTVTGIDPSFTDGDRFRKGSVYSIPVANGHADAVLLIEVLQHVDDMERAMSELTRVTREGGYLIIGDRDPHSLVGFLKPFMETAGRWMYPWDSPFREKWRSIMEWKDVLGEGWRITFARSFSHPDNRIPMSNRFYLLIARKKEG